MQIRLNYFSSLPCFTQVVIPKKKRNSITTSCLIMVLNIIVIISKHPQVTTHKWYTSQQGSKEGNRCIYHKSSVILIGLGQSDVCYWKNIKYLKKINIIQKKWFHSSLKKKRSWFTNCSILINVYENHEIWNCNLSHQIFFFNVLVFFQVLKSTTL